MPHTGYFWQYDKEAVDAVNAAGLHIVAGKDIFVDNGTIVAQRDDPMMSPLLLTQLGDGAIFFGQHIEAYKIQINKDGNMFPVGNVDGVDISGHATDESAHHAKTVAEELNHQDLANRGVADHHAKYTAADVYAALGLRPKIVEIGDWDMDANPNMSVAHGLTQANIRPVQVIIRNDDNDQYTPLDFTSDTETSAGHWNVTGDNVLLNRLTTGVYDSVNYDSTSYNRGWVVIWYVP